MTVETERKQFCTCHPELSEWNQKLIHCSYDEVTAMLEPVWYAMDFEKSNKIIGKDCE